MLEDIVKLYELDLSLEVELPNMFGESCSYKINWIRKILDNYYEVAMKDKIHDGCTTWLCKIKDEVVLPISCTMYFNEEESRKLKLADKLNIKSAIIHYEILKERISKCQKIDTL